MCVYYKRVTCIIFSTWKFHHMAFSLPLKFTAGTMYIDLHALIPHFVKGLMNYGGGESFATNIVFFMIKIH